MHRSLWILLALALALLPAGAHAQDIVDFARDWLVIGPNSGQHEGDATQYHTEGYTQCFNTHPDWCNDLTPGVKVRGGFSKSYMMNPASATWFSSGVPGCVPYVQALKEPSGQVAEFGCMVNDRMDLVWEVLPPSVRKFHQKVGSQFRTGYTWGLATGQPSGGFSPSVETAKVDVYSCSGGNPAGPTSSSTPKGGALWYLFNITGEFWRGVSIPEIRDLGLVPASMPDSEVIPAAWYTTFLQQMGRSGQNVYLMIRKDWLDLHCGSLSCANWVESYWYLAASPFFVEWGPVPPDIFSYGLVRWNVQSLSAGKFYREGVGDTFVVETGAGRKLARQICR